MDIKKLEIGPLGTNCYLLWDTHQNGIVIDPGGEAEKVLSEISQLDLRIQYIVATHVHFDHIGAVPELTTQLNGKFVLHKQEKQIFSYAERMANSYGFPDWTVPTPDQYIEEGDQLQASDHLTFHVFHTPGHTPGSISLYWQEEDPGRLFSGDLVFPARPGRTDFLGGDADTMEQSLKKIAELPEETMVHPGHDWAITIKKVKEFI